MSPWVPPTGQQVDHGPGPLDRWVVSDAWFLAAVRVTGTPSEPAVLADILVATDAVNGAVISRLEIEHALSRLVPAGLIEVDERGFAVTAAGRELVARARGTAPERMAAMLTRLEQLHVDPEDWEVDAAQYEDAVFHHRQTVREGLRREMRTLWRR